MLCFFHCGALMLCSTMLRVALPAPHGRQLTPARDPTATEAPSAPAGSRRGPRDAPCLAADTYAALREAAGGDGELANRSRSQFGICGVSDGSAGSALLQLAKETGGNPGRGLEVLHPTGVLISEEDERGALVLTFDLPPSPLLRRRPALLLALEGHPTGGNLDVTCTSRSLQPHAQTACISGETWYITLTGKASEDDVPQKWRISVEAKSPDNLNRSLKEILTGGRSGSNISVVPLLLFSGKRGTDTRYHQNSSPASSQTSFLCELKRFLGDVLPQDLRESSPLQLDSLKSLPPLTLGPSSSDTLLAGLINSSSITVFSFRSRASGFQVHSGELAFSPELLEELRRRLEAEVVKITAVMREEQVGRGATERLGRLRELSALPMMEPAPGGRQYRAFLLLKALQTAARAYEAQRGQRATRAGPDITARANKCGLKSLSVTLDRRLDIPNIININNCHGSCAYPLADATNHAVLLNYHVEVDNAEERAPCCVPVAYEALQMVEVKDHGTEISLKPDMVAKECECR